MDRDPAEIQQRGDGGEGEEQVQRARAVGEIAGEETAEETACVYDGEQVGSDIAGGVTLREGVEFHVVEGDVDADEAEEETEGEEEEGEVEEGSEGEYLAEGGPGNALAHEGYGDGGGG